jgi:hypothetical protein
MLLDTSLSPQDMEIKEENLLLFWGLYRTSMLEPQPSLFRTCNVARGKENLKPPVFIGESTLHMQKYTEWGQPLTQCPRVAGSERENFRPVNVHGGFQFTCRG